MVTPADVCLMRPKGRVRYQQNRALRAGFSYSACQALFDVV